MIADFQAEPHRSIDALSNLTRRVHLSLLLEHLSVVIHPIPSSVDLSQPEYRFITQARASRQAEFLTGRLCAHQALAALNQSTDCLPVGARGAPCWPDGVVGSITHDGGFAIAVVTCQTRETAIGIDLIDLHRKPASLPEDSILSRADERALQAAALAGRILLQHNSILVLLAFSLKEAVVKAVSPRIDHYMDLRDIHLEFRDGALMATYGPTGFQLLLSAAMDQRFIYTIARLAKEVI